MSDDNKRNIMFFESRTMRGLFERMDEWQAAHHKRFHSASIHKDGDLYCCIALSNPTEVVIVSGGAGSAKVTYDGHLQVIEETMRSRHARPY